MNTPVSPSARAPSVRIALRAFGRTFRHGYENIGTLAMVGVLWLLGIVLIVPLGPVMAALHRITRPMTEERTVSWRSFGDHLRADFRWSSALAWLLIGGYVLLQANIAFYAGSTLPVVRLVGAVFGGLGVLWSGMNLVSFPLALRQERLSLRLTLRNAALMTIANAPGIVLALVLLIALMVLLLVLPPLFMLIPGFTALYAQEFVRLILIANGYIAEDPIADRKQTLSDMFRTPRLPRQRSRRE